MNQTGKVPIRAWVVTFAGTAVNLCLGILYAWSVWKRSLVAPPRIPAGSPMTGLNEGWTYLTDAEATWAYALCGFIFALVMIPAGRIQDRFGPKIGATLGGLFLAGGCILAGLMKSYAGLIVGFGLLGGIGMGLGYAASTPAAVKWFGPQRRGLIVGLVVGGYGGAAIYISPLAEYLMAHFGLSGSFIGLGLLFAVVVVVAGQMLAWPPAGYVPPSHIATAQPKQTMTSLDWPAGAMVKTWQFYALVFLFIGSAQSGLLVIANATEPRHNTPPHAKGILDPYANPSISLGLSLRARAYIFLRATADKRCRCARNASVATAGQGSKEGKFAKGITEAAEKVFPFPLRCQRELPRHEGQMGWA